MIPPIGHPLAAITTGPSPTAVDLPDVSPRPVPHLAGAREMSSDASTAGHDSPRDAMTGAPPPMEKALDSVNRSLEAWSTGMRFEMDEDAQRLVVSIIDSATGEVLRTVPSDAVLRVAKMIVQLQGAGVDTRA
ncbi:flagellar protein FlaG [Castellaniella sp. GW247-6E4]|uniref:flagellar protein FlaG n=1 Tax=Castellaniella sp. GW247-6E4 TaxID=3140380 RepID=UPI0033160CA2